MLSAPPCYTKRLTLTRIQRSALFAQSLSSILLEFLTKKDPLIFCLLLLLLLLLLLSLLILLLHFHKQIKEIPRLRLYVYEITVVYREQPVGWMDHKMGQHFIDAYVVMTLFDFARDC